MALAASLLRAARAHALNLIAGSDIFIARLAGAINQFKEPCSAWWTRFSKLRGAGAPTFDLKKLGTFPIVHGARALALEHRLDALSTVDRLRALASQQFLSQELARDLVETLHFMMTLKLRNNLRQIALRQPVNNLVELTGLSTLDRDQIKNAVAIIKQFRLHLQLHYRLEA